MMKSPMARDLRGLVKSCLAHAMHGSRLDRVVGRRRGRQGKPLVIGYHRVVEDYDHSDRLSISAMLTSVKTFEAHLDWIGRRYDFVSLDELAAVMESQPQRRRPVAAITFDDGYRDVYQQALPVLRRKGIPSAVFVVSNLVDTHQLLDHDELHLLFIQFFSLSDQARQRHSKAICDSGALAAPQAEILAEILLHGCDTYLAVRGVLEAFTQQQVRQVIALLSQYVELKASMKEDFLTLDSAMLKDMAACGVTIGSHTKSHLLLANESLEVVREELEGSRADLEHKLAMEIKHFAYPDGSFNEQTVHAAAAAGYKTAHTVCAHQHQQQPLLTISRKMLWQNSCVGGGGEFSPDILSCMVNGIFDPAEKCRLAHRA